jgi:hypothetical protein
MVYGWFWGREFLKKMNRGGDLGKKCLDTMTYVDLKRIWPGVTTQPIVLINCCWTGDLANINWLCGSFGVGR